MKKTIIIVLSLFTSAISMAQSDTTKIEQYCQIIATPRFLSNKVTIDLDFGDEKKFWQDTRMKTDEGKLKKFNTVIDALNYMGQSGWEFINAYPVRNGTSDIYHFAFKKKFSKSEIGKNQ